jgi:FtsP/CotA-like multicopper oxidase with cupredoxin domain
MPDAPKPRLPLPDVPEEQFPVFHRHVCPPTFSGGPIDPVTPTRRLERQLLANTEAVFPDGEKLPMWTIEDREDPVNGKTFPSRLIRTVEGDIVHARVHNATNTHTIHWHGIEPSPINDGVGKHSFEVSGNFVYQFATNQAGTFFFHCHKNTTLHFERGLYGLFIVDPKKPATPEAAGIPEPPYPTGGPGFVAALNPPTNVRKYDIEAAWVFDDIDTSWVKLGHNAFMQKCDKDDPIGRNNPDNFTNDGVLNNFRPDVFAVTGHLRRKTDTTPFNEIAVNARVGDTILIRALNASYSIQEYRIGLPLEVIGMDGHPLGVPPFGSYSQPIKRQANEPFRLTSAMRHDLLITADQPGSFPVEVKFIQWITGEELYTARTSINIS